MFGAVCDYCGYYQITCRWVNDLSAPDDRVCCGDCLDRENGEGKKLVRAHLPRPLTIVRS